MYVCALLQVVYWLAVSLVQRYLLTVCAEDSVLCASEYGFPHLMSNNFRLCDCLSLCILPVYCLQRLAFASGLLFLNVKCNDLKCISEKKICANFNVLMF